LLAEAAAELGNNPRRAIMASQGQQHMSFAWYEVRDALLGMTDIPGVLCNIANQVLPYRVFSLVPLDDNRIYSQALIKPATTFVLEALMALQAEQYHEGDLFDLYQALVPIPTAAELRGRMWERAVHAYLGSRPLGYSLPLRALNTSASLGAITFSTETKPHMFTFDNELHSKLVEQVEAKSACYLYSQIRGFPTVDSILYQPDQRPWLLQASVASTHDIEVDGLTRLQAAMHPGTNLLPLRSSDKEPWNFVFVVPKGKGSEYTGPQRITESVGKK
jgi:hypothetical protein